MKKYTLGAALVAVSLASSFAYAQEDASTPRAGVLPGNPFYYLETLSEGIGSLFTFDAQAKAERYLALAEERLAEAQALADKNKTTRVADLAKKYEARLEEALIQAGVAEEKGVDVTALLSKIATSSTRHQAVLASVLSKAPEQARQAIEQAMMNSLKGRTQALESIAKRVTSSGTTTVPLSPRPATSTLDKGMGQEKRSATSTR